MDLRSFTKLLGPLKRRVLLMIGRAVLQATTDDRGRLELKISMHAGETLDGVEAFQDYGFASRPHAGAEAITGSIGGERSHTVVVAIDDRRYRPKDLETGETRMYDDQGQAITIFRDRIEIRSDKKVVVESPDIHLGGEGGERVARIGDKVEVGSGSSIGLWPIVEGSEKVSAV